jgi:transcriptional regulator with XRE-family HTH domain
MLRRIQAKEDALMVGEVQAPRSPDNVDVEVGRLVRVERIARGLSQTRLGDQIGVTFQQVQKYESGVNRISMGRLTRIARVVKVDVTYLLGGSRRTARTPAQSLKERAKVSEALRMLGRIGALRLLRAFAAIPVETPRLRESIVQIVEGAAAAARVGGARRRPSRR